MDEAQKKCMAVLSVCIPSDQQERLMRNPIAVVTTDNNCKMEDYTMVGQNVTTCVKDHGYDFDSHVDLHKLPTVTEEQCNKIKTGTQECILELKVDCFSDRENEVIKDLSKTVFKNGKEAWPTETGKNMMRKIITCILEAGSGQPSDSLYMVIIFNVILGLYTFQTTK